MEFPSRYNDNGQRRPDMEPRPACPCVPECDTKPEKPECHPHPCPPCPCPPHPCPPHPCPPHPDFTKSKTYQNLLAAYAGELKATSKYQIYAILAREDGYEQIGNIFDETSGNEREHAELWLKWIHGGEEPGTTENLEDAIHGEHEEWSEMYPRFAREAKEEGYDELATLFLRVGAIEHSHQKRYCRLLDNIHDGKVFCDKPCTVWVCLNCGHIHRGECAPEHCPVCGYPQAWFERRCTNY